MWIILLSHLFIFSIILAFFFNQCSLQKIRKLTLQPIYYTCLSSSFLLSQYICHFEFLCWESPTELILWISYISLRNFHHFKNQLSLALEIRSRQSTWWCESGHIRCFLNIFLTLTCGEKLLMFSSKAWLIFPTRFVGNAAVSFLFCIFFSSTWSHANSFLFQCRYSTSQDAFLTPNAMTHPGRLGSPHPRGSQLNLRENHKRSELKLPVSLTN